MNKWEQHFADVLFQSNNSDVNKDLGLKAKVKDMSNKAKDLRYQN